MPIIRFIDYVTRKVIAHRSLDSIPRKGERLHIEYDNLPPADFYVHQVHWVLLPNKEEVVKVYLENAKGYE